MSAPTATPAPEPRRPLVFRHATVLTMDGQRQVLTDTDVLVVGERIEAVGPGLPVPDGTVEVDAGRGIVMPGMVDTASTHGGR